MDSFWSVANALKDAVKQQTAEITASLQNTDWKTEINALQEGLKEDTVEIGQKAKEVTEELGQKTIHVAKNLPQVVDEGRRKAVAQLEHLPGSSSARAKEAAAQLQQAGASLTQMGHRVVANTSEMFDHFSNAIQAEMNAAQDRDSLATFSGGGSIGASASSHSLNRGESSKFSRFDADVAAMQRDSSTYCDEPDDTNDFEAWTAAFNLHGAKPDIAKLLSENTFMSELQARIVPVVVDYESFWTRYFYRLHKLEERHAKVAALASRTHIQEDNLGWDTEEEEEDEEEKRELEEKKVENVVDEEKDILVQDDDGDQDEDEVELAVEEAVASPTGNSDNNGLELKEEEKDESNKEIRKNEEDIGEAEVEPMSALNDAEEDPNKPGSALNDEKEEDKEGETGAATDGTAKQIETAAVVESEKKKKKKGTKEDVTDNKDEDEFSSLDFSGAEDVPEGEGDDDDGSDWGDVAEWE